MPAVPCVRPSHGSVHGAENLQLTRGFRNQQADLPMTGVEAESDRIAVLGAQSAVRAEDEKLRVEQATWIPAHARILGQSEEISGWLGEQHLRG